MKAFRALILLVICLGGCSILLLSEAFAGNINEANISKTILFSPQQSDTLSSDSSVRVQNVFAPNSVTMPYFIIDPADPAVVLTFEVFTRTGLLVYKIEAPAIYWDGRNTSGQDLNTGVYFYTLKAKSGDPTGYYTKLGFIHLFR